MLSKLLAQLKRRKFVAGIILVLIVGGIYWGYTKIFSNSGAIRYVTVQAEKGTLIVSVSGSGQVSASNQIDIKPKVSGDIIYVGVKSDQEVKTGTLIVQINAENAQKTVADAEENLEQAKFNLEKMKGGITTNEGTVRGIKEKAVDNLKKAQEDGFNTVTNIFLELPGLMTGFQDMFFSYTLGGGDQWNIDYYFNAISQYVEDAYKFKNDVYIKYLAAREAYDKNFSDYKSASRFSDVKTIESLIDQTYETSKLIAETVKSANNLIQLYKDKFTERNRRPNTLADTHLSQLNTYTSKTNSYLSNLLSIKNTIQNNKENIIDVNFQIADQENLVTRLENAFLEAKAKLADYSVRAPFTGIITKVNVKKGDSVSSATTLATLITKQKIAEITLNEIDAANVKTEQKATLTFDAVPDLTISGQVAEFDAIGTVSQGVVTYKVKITFDTQDERIKPAMSVTADIITGAKQDVVLAPNSAVKYQNNIYLVEVMTDDNTPRSQTVEIGISNDTMTEIINGLKEGDIIITSTISPNKAQTTQTKTTQIQGFQIPGMNSGGGQIKSFSR